MTVELGFVSFIVVFVVCAMVFLIRALKPWRDRMNAQIEQHNFENLDGATRAE